MMPIGMLCMCGAKIAAPKSAIYGLESFLPLSQTLGKQQIDADNSAEAAEGIGGDAGHQY
jgi:hypothetical protein